MLVDGWLARAAAGRPDHPALATPTGTLSYGQLHAEAAAAADELEALGAARGARVGIALPAGLDFARALHACLLIGAAVVPVDLRLSPSEREHLLARCDLVVGEPPPVQGGDTATRRRSGAPRGRHDLDATALMMHTSGTSSAPKEVQLTYGNLLWSALGSAVALGAPTDERWLCVMPLSHMGGLSILVRSAIYATTAVVHEQFELERVLAALHGGEVTLVSLVATTLQRLLDAGLERPPGLRCVLLGGGPVGGSLLERARAAGVPVALTYGLTEACSQVATVPAAALTGTGPVRRGAPPLFCSRVEIAADEEILVRGPTVAPEAVAEDGWLHTGDLGELAPDGWLSVLGRRAETIISGGENVAPAEVESVLDSHPSVLEAGVFGVADEQWGEAVSAVVVLREERDQPGPASIEELRAHCAMTLAPYKVPKRISLSESPLPRTRSGKLLRRELG
ncbi:MAG TPA: AMP-binding protein [Solirubrobacteraceae bacterium]|nr:AMP-binding protein [Solirubrobacteraceae bacterium]